MRVVSFTSYDYNGAKSVPVIASFDNEGHIAPLYVRLGEASCKVKSYWVKYAYHNIIEFNCMICDNDSDKVKPLLLQYHQAECVWVVA